VSHDAALVLDSLFHLTPEEQLAAAATPGAIPDLVVALSIQDPILQIGAGELLWTLICNTPGSLPASAVAAAYPTVISKIGDIMIESNNIQVQSKGVQLVWEIAPHMYDRCRPEDLYVVRGITTLVVEMLRDPEQAVQEQAAVELEELGRCGGCLEPECVSEVFEGKIRREYLLNLPDLK
jgi:hypothetical protein